MKWDAMDTAVYRAKLRLKTAEPILWRLLMLQELAAVIAAGEMALDKMRLTEAEAARMLDLTLATEYEMANAEAASARLAMTG